MVLNRLFHYGPNSRGRAPRTRTHQNSIVFGKLWGEFCTSSNSASLAVSSVKFDAGLKGLVRSGAVLLTVWFLRVRMSAMARKKCLWLPVQVGSSIRILAADASCTTTNIATATVGTVVNNLIAPLLGSTQRKSRTHTKAPTTARRTAAGDVAPPTVV